MPDFAPCDREIFLHGDVVSIEALSKEEAEAKVLQLRKADPSHRYDWHYVAGRAVFKRLPVIDGDPAEGAPND